MARRRIRDESRRNRHLDQDFLLGRHALHGDKRAPGADVDRGAKLEDRSAGRVGTVNENWEGDRESLPAAGLIFGFTHDLILQVFRAVAEITQVAGAK